MEAIHLRDRAHGYDLHPGSMFLGLLGDADVIYGHCYYGVSC